MLSAADAIAAAGAAGCRCSLRVLPLLSTMALALVLVLVLLRRRRWRATAAAALTPRARGRGRALPSRVPSFGACLPACLSPASGRGCPCSAPLRCVRSSSSASASRSGSGSGSGCWSGYPGAASGVSLRGRAAIRRQKGANERAGAKGRLAMWPPAHRQPPHVCDHERRGAKLKFY